MKTPKTKPSKRAKATKPKQDARPAPAQTSAPLIPIKSDYGKRARLTDIELDPKLRNPRTDFDTQEDKEHTDSIRDNGILTPMWVRPGLGPGKYWLIAGERRWRNGKEAGAIDGPIVIFHVDDHQAAKLQIIENLERLDIGPIEEGQGYKRLIDEHGYDVKSIAAELHKSKSYIYGRIKLLDLGILGIQSLKSGKIDQAVALRLARIPGKEQQVAALKAILDDPRLNTDQASAKLIEEKFSRELKGAPFNTTDTTLHPERGSCLTCSFRSGNQKELFGEKGTSRADVCTDPPCYLLKVAAHDKRRLDRIKASGGEVITGGRAHAVLHSDDYIKLDDFHPTDSDDRTWRDVLGEHTPAISLCIFGDEIEVVRKADALEAIKRHKIKVSPLSEQGPLDLEDDESEDAPESAEPAPPRTVVASLVNADMQSLAYGAACSFANLEMLETALNQIPATDGGRRADIEALIATAKRKAEQLREVEADVHADIIVRSAIVRAIEEQSSNAVTRSIIRFLARFEIDNLDDDQAAAICRRRSMEYDRFTEQSAQESLKALVDTDNLTLEDMLAFLADLLMTAVPLEAVSAFASACELDLGVVRSAARAEFLSGESK
jgi:ParB/RepB/Spo0J family partition protein